MNVNFVILCRTALEEAYASIRVDFVLDLEREFRGTGCEPRICVEDDGVVFGLPLARVGGNPNVRTLEQDNLNSFFAYHGELYKKTAMLHFFIEPGLDEKTDS